MNVHSVCFVLSRVELDASQVKVLHTFVGVEEAVFVLIRAEGLTQGPLHAR